jgi:hypothetical protein
VLNDANLTETSGAIGINGTPDTRFRLDVNGSTRLRGSNPGFNLEGLRAAGNLWLFQTVDDDGRFRLFSQDNLNPGQERLTISLLTGNVGIGVSNPGTKLEVVNPVRQLRFGPTAADNGGYLISTAPSQAIIAGGGRWNGTNWIARDTGASMTTHENGTIHFFTDSNLSVDSPFNPTQRMWIESNGNVNIGPVCCGPARLTVYAPSPSFGIMHTDGTGAAIVSEIDVAGSARLGTLNSNPLFLMTNHNPRMVLDTIGNVGIGTIAPLTELDVRGNLVLDPGASPTLFTSAANTEQNRYLHLINSPSVASASGLKAGGILVADDYSYAFPTKNDLIVKGFVGIGLGANVAPANPLHVAGNIRIGSGTSGCVLDNDGTVIAGTCSSDARFKRDIVPFAHLLDKLAQLQPVQFYWRAEEFKERHFGTKPSFGLIAQEVEKVLPELVTEDEQGYKAVNYSKLPLLTLQAIKELKAENDALKQRLSQQQASAALQQQQSRQLKKQQTQIERQQREIDELRQVVKALKPGIHNHQRK